MSRVVVKKLPFGDFTNEGSYYPVIDGHNIGENGRAFWPTAEEARACGERAVAAMEGAQP